ncbi:plasmid pRiA4b ORF-3 family protein [Actinoplanes sp. NPDC051851]|uniref:plasmid pRiA4b ORF-3 family protein n=1 Tax=Actinoplanes sp. NPDC051851 TaxID=3154753 RepID=UPI00342C5EDD
MNGSVDVAGTAHLARGCLMAEQARTLASWVGRPGRTVTAGRVLRRADVAAAGAVLGVPVPEKVRTAADVPALHRPWSFALGSGLLKISGSVAAAGPALEQWSSSADTEALDAWWAGFRAVCTAESDSRHEGSMIALALAFLEAVSLPDGADPNGSWHRVTAIVERHEEEKDWSERVQVHSVTQYLDYGTGDRFAGLVQLLGRLGAVTGDDSATVAVTALGRWSLARAQAERPSTVTLDMPAQAVAEVLADHVRRGTDPWTPVRRWLEFRRPAVGARELLTAAADLSAAARIGAGDVADGLGDEAPAVWQAVAHLPNLGAHARVSLTALKDDEPYVTPADARWLAVEFATAALDGTGPDEALTVLFDRLPGESVDTRLDVAAGIDHPDATRVTAAVHEFLGSGAVPSIDQVYQLKVGLMRWRPPIWRRILVPSTIMLGDLHVVIQLLFGWDGDHLHQFAVGGKRYTDPYFRLGGDERDESEVRLREAFAGGTKKIRYEYDFGASWWHEITLERTPERDPAATYPLCTAFSGDSPVEYWSEDDPQEPEPFDLTEINRRLAELDNTDNGGR